MSINSDNEFTPIYFCSNECARCRKSPLTNQEKKLNRMLCNKCYRIVEGKNPPTLEEYLGMEKF